MSVFTPAITSLWAAASVEAHICQHHLCRIVEVGNRVVAAIKRIPRKEFHGALHGWPKLSGDIVAVKLSFTVALALKYVSVTREAGVKEANKPNLVPFRSSAEEIFRTSGHDTSASAHIMHCHWHPFTRHFLFDARKENNRKEDYHHHRFDTIIS